MKLFDERFLTHRLRSTSIAGVTGGVLAVGIWFYRYVFQHHWSWDLFAVALTMAIVKQGLMMYFRFTD